MNWSSYSDFIEMGGYALYVWGSYLMVLGALLWEVLLLQQRRRRAQDGVRQHAVIYGAARDTAS